VNQHTDKIRKCPKCGYERKENEIAPEWECPKCGIVYNKFKIRTYSSEKESSTTLNMETNDSLSELEYVGFWARTGAFFIDLILIYTVTYPFLIAIYGEKYYLRLYLRILFGNNFIQAPQGIADFLISYLFPTVAIIMFWNYKLATPGKLAIGAKIVDAETGMNPTIKQFIIRYLGYIASILPLGLGCIWVSFDTRRQSWHDKLANTVVIRSKNRNPEPVKFDKRNI